MKRRSHSWVGMSLPVVVLSVAGAWVARADLSSTLHQVFQVTAGGKLSVHVDQGSIEVQPGSGAEVKIDVFRKVTHASDKKAEEVLAAHEVTFTQDGSQVTVNAQLHRNAFKRNWWRSGPNLEVRYVISTPTHFNFDLNTAAGGVKIGACVGEVRANSSAGSLHLDECDGRATLHTSAGSIHVGKVTGPLKARTSAGTIEIAAAGSSVQAITSAGSIRAAFASSPDADCELRSSAGSVEVRLPEKANLRLDAETSAGTVHCSLPVASEGSRKNHRLVGKLGEGGPLLKLRTSAGSIRIE